MAAYHDTNAAETDPARTFAVNAVGAFYVARACAAHGKKLVFASTDYVFGRDATRTTPYVESDPTGPVNVYGVSKAAGEDLVRAVCENHLIIRTSNLFGGASARKGWTFPEMVVHRATAGEALKVVSDQVMSPTYVPDLVVATLDLLERDARGIVHLSNSGECSWYDYARRILDLMGIRHPVMACRGADFPSPAQRPAYSAMASERLAEYDLPPMRPWEKALEAYVRDLRPE